MCRLFRLDLNSYKLYRLALVCQYPGEISGRKLLIFKTLKDQEHGALRFYGMIQTDGVGVTVLKKRREDTGRVRTRHKVAVERICYINELNHDEQNQVVGRCVSIDPGRRDLLYCVHELSTPNHPISYKYTEPNQDKLRQTRRYRRILENIKPNEVNGAEKTMVNSTSFVLDQFEEFLLTMNAAHDLLKTR
ncbi:MAG: hypothetical protein EXX96DRAFT_489831 [Benjaminiella poitrasii]|nr:MAG: hypothetical protein EXX96DRAFT_489831 [Benjaminiella poitrasii]